MVLASSGWSSVKCSNFLEASVIKLDGLQFSGELQALGKVVLSGLQDFVTKVVVVTGKEQLVLEEPGHVLHPLKLGFSNGGNRIS